MNFPTSITNQEGIEELWSQWANLYLAGISHLEKQFAAINIIKLFEVT